MCIHRDRIERGTICTRCLRRLVAFGWRLDNSTVLCYRCLRKACAAAGVACPKRTSERSTFPKVPRGQPMPGPYRKRKGARAAARPVRRARPTEREVAILVEVADCAKQLVEADYRGDLSGILESMEVAVARLELARDRRRRSSLAPPDRAVGATPTEKAG